MVIDCGYVVIVLRHVVNVHTIDMLLSAVVINGRFVSMKRGYMVTNCGYVVIEFNMSTKCGYLCNK